MFESVAKSFIGGIHPSEEKHHTEKKPLEVMPPPERVVIPLRQHLGAPARAMVKIGESVKTGQCIAKGAGFVTAAMHASISGEVVSIKQQNHPVFRSCEAVKSSRMETMNGSRGKSARAKKSTRSRPMTLRGP